MQTKLQEESNRLFRQQKQFPVRVARQRHFMQDESDVVTGLRMLIEGVEIYLRGQKAEFRNTPEKDEYLKDLTMRLLEGVHGLLNENGVFDGATCSRAISLIKEEYGL